MNIIDISRSIAPDSAIFPGDPELKFDWYVDMASGGTWNELMIHGWTGHRMAHMDSPKHFVKNGDSITDLDLSRFISPAVVVEVDADVITREHIEPLENIEGRGVKGTRTSHEIIIRQDPLLHEMVGRSTVMVNSTHHQAIRT